MKDKESVQEPCRDQLYCISRKDKLGIGRQDVMRPQPDVYQQINYAVPFRLAKGFSILRGGDI